MKKLPMVAVALLLTVCGLTGFSQAAYFDFSTMGFVNGENFENKTLDIATFTSETNNLIYYSAYGGGIGTSNAGATGDTYVAFSQPVSALSFTAGDGGGDYDAFAVTVYQFGTNNLIGTWSTPLFGGPNEPEWYTLNVPAANVGRAVFDPGNSGVLPGSKDEIGGVIITEMGYRVVTPVPSALLLLGSGLAALAAWRSRRAS